MSVGKPCSCMTTAISGGGTTLSRTVSVIRQVLRRFNRTVSPGTLAQGLSIQGLANGAVSRGCYRAEDSGHFAPHRDNTTKGTAHRRFAASVNLNADFDGGEVSFPEYGPRGFAGTGGAVVFSCSLLHSVSKVTRGSAYAFLPFIYDEEAAKIRAANHAFLAQEQGTGPTCSRSLRG